jgi:uncharacterized protein YjiS (DUF1127 family)
MQRAHKGHAYSCVARFPSNFYLPPVTKTPSIQQGVNEMAAIDTTRFEVAAPQQGAGLFARMIESVVAWNEARVTRAALMRLTERELNDIGLTRGQIELVARNGRAY